MTQLRHHKSNKPIGNPLICVDDFGDEVFVCQYTGELATASTAISLGATVPQVGVTYICAPGANPAFRQSRREFDALDANCNMCQHFRRLPHEKDRGGLLRGACEKGVVHDRMVYRVNDGEFWIHPDDHMGMDCWRGRAPR